MQWGGHHGCPPRRQDTGQPSTAESAVRGTLHGTVCCRGAERSGHGRHRSTGRGCTWTEDWEVKYIPFDFLKGTKKREHGSEKFPFHAFICAFGLTEVCRGRVQEACTVPEMQWCSRIDWKTSQGWTREFTLPNQDCFIKWLQNWIKSNPITQQDNFLNHLGMTLSK